MNFQRKLRIFENYPRLRNITILIKKFKNVNIIFFFNFLIIFLELRIFNCS